MAKMKAKMNWVRAGFITLLVAANGLYARGLIAEATAEPVVHCRTAQAGHCKCLGTVCTHNLGDTDSCKGSSDCEG